ARCANEPIPKTTTSDKASVATRAADISFSRLDMIGEQHEPVTTVTPERARYSCMALLRTHDARDDRLPLVDLALKILRDLGGTHRLGLDGILLHQLAHLRPVHGVDDFVIDA